MYCGEAEGQRFLGREEVANVAPGIILASGALASQVKWFSVFGEFGLFNPYCIIRNFQSF